MHLVMFLLRQSLTLTPSFDFFESLYHVTWRKVCQMLIATSGRVLYSALMTYLSSVFCQYFSPCPPCCESHPSGRLLSCTGCCGFCCLSICIEQQLHPSSNNGKISVIFTPQESTSGCSGFPLSEYRGQHCCPFQTSPALDPRKKFMQQEPS